MRCLITGAGGFVGSHLAEALRDAGHDVVAMARYSNRDTFGWLDEVDGVERVRGDVCDAHQMMRLVGGVDRVYHLAAYGSVPYSFDAPRQFVDVNTVGTLNVALACIEHDVELVHTSTSEVYGNAPPPQHEGTPLCALSPYAASKIGADQLVRSLCASRWLNAVILRPFNTYGPRQSARAVIPRIILRCNDRNARTVELGNLTPKRDLMYVSDTVAAFMAVEPSEDCPTFVACTGSSIAIGDLARRLLHACGRDDIRIVDVPGRTDTAEVWYLRGDCSLLREATGWVPKVSLNDGLSRTIAWVAARGEQLVEGVV